LSEKQFSLFFFAGGRIVNGKKWMIGAVLAVAAAAPSAQQPGFTRALMQDQNLSVPGRHAVVARAEFIPGGQAGRHTHPGEELGYVVEGTLELVIDGQPPKTVKAGEVFFVPAGMVHDGRNVGSGKAVVLATYIVETGKPVASPAK
jgi:quercetin dioxygenase-like cupin family protein